MMIRFFFAAVALVAGVSAACAGACGDCLFCVMGNLTTGACADCDVCYDSGCTIPAADATDGFGVLLDGLACELNALDFYGEMHCRTQALTVGYMTCFADPLETQFLGCMAADITAEYGACITNVSTMQVATCVGAMVSDELLANNDEQLGIATASCETFWLEAQESTCNTAAMTIQDSACKTDATVADKQAGITGYAAEFGTIVAASQTYACANAGKTFSPTVRTKTPTLATRSPTLKTNTPTIKTGVPTLRTKTPTLKTGSPVITTTPTLRTASPTIKTKAPTRSPTLKTTTPVTGTPTIKSASPTGSPTIWTRVPTVKTKTPVTACPTIKTKTPTSKTSSPTRIPVSNSPSTSSPTIKTKTPVTATPVTSNPTVTTRTPVTASPTIKTSAPTTMTATPVTGAPTTKTIAPTTITKSPTKAATFAPTTLTASPVSGAPTTMTRTPVTATPVSGAPTTKTRTPVTFAPVYTDGPTRIPVTSIPTTKTKTPVTSGPTIRTRAPTLAPQTSSPTIRTKAPVTTTPVTTTPVTSTPTGHPTIKTQAPTIDTKTPTIKTKTPVSSSPTGTPVSVAPTTKTSSPTSTPTRTPVSVAPTIKTKTPTLKTASPTLKTNTPTSKTTSPTLKTASPTLKTTSPTLKTTSPTLKTTSPTLKTKAPTTSPTTGPTISTSSPTSSPTTACYGKADTCKTGFLALFDYTATSVKSAADVWTALNASLCTNSSYDMMQPFYANVMGCYLNQTSCTGTDSYSVTAKRILDNADSCKTDHTQSICSTTGVTGQTACASAKSTCQAALDARTYNSTNLQGCSAATFAAATACNATKLACETCLDIDASGTCTDCVNTTQIGFAACTTSRTGCNSFISSVSTNATGCTELTTYDAIFLTKITDFATALTSCSAGLMTGDYSKCTVAQLASLLTCSNKGASCGEQLGLQAAGKTADTVNCSAVSLASYEGQCVGDIEICLGGNDFTKCRVAQTVASATACYANISLCTALRTDAYCTGDAISQLKVCDSNLEMCATGVFATDPDALTADEQTALDTCFTTNPEVITGLQDDGKCWNNNELCGEYLETMDVVLAGTCDSIAGFADSDYPTLNIWIEKACSNDAPRTAPPTAAPKVVLSVALKTQPTAAQETTSCEIMRTVALKQGITLIANQLFCSTEVETTETTRRRLLNSTTTTLYKIMGSVKATQAAAVGERLAKIDQTALVASLNAEMLAADPVLAAEATVAVEPLETSAPTKMPTPAPTPAAPTSPPPPTAAAAPTPADPVYSSSQRITPSLVAVMALSLVLL